MSIIIWKQLSQTQLELDVVEHALAQDHVLAEQLLGVRRVGDQRQEGVEQVVEDLHDACLADAARLEVLHSILSGEVDGLDFRDRVADLGGLLVQLLLLADSLVAGAARRLLEDVDLVANENFDGYLASSLALSDPLLDSVERRPLGDVEQVDDSGATVDVLVNVLVVALLARHVEVYDLVLVGVVDVERGLQPSELKPLTLMCSSLLSSFSTTLPSVCEMASRKVVLPTPESPTRAILNRKW